MFQKLILSVIVLSIIGNAAKENIQSKPNLIEQFEKNIQTNVDSPSEVVRKFYQNLREGKFRQAWMMTNLKPAIEQMTDAELSEFKEDFEIVANKIPETLQITGEIITENSATVTIKVFDEDTNSLEDRVLKLRKEKDSWVILIVDEAAESFVRQEGKNYLYQLKIETHESEAQAMLQRIVKAQAVYALQNSGQFADLKTLVQIGLLPDDILDTKSTGYKYKVVLSSDKKRYYASAEPAIYGKTGKLSFLLECEGINKETKLQSKDNKGKPIKD
ncbi:MAG: hypothetical protein N2Z23_00190 [Pyrinomonadaceae bacterium]|nr:hypothetical protein [Pyrinomonadaceae bacterium]MCX7638852.1 hypothetical protein [Pyrinomonadaceae bacterium]MDW8305012.1 hypothetical protein [Acidobacteriota bacterium]